VATTRARPISGSRPAGRGPAVRPLRLPDAQPSSGEAWLEAVERAAAHATAAALSPGTPGAAAEAVETVLRHAAIDARRVAASVLDRALVDPRLAEHLPAAALHAQVVLIAALTGSDEVSVWAAADPATTPTFLASAGGARPSRRTAAAARLAIGQGLAAAIGTRSPTLAVPVTRFGVTQAAVAVRLAGPHEREAAEALAVVAARRIAPVLERGRLLEQGEQQARSLVAAAEKRLVRVGYDLHDGPVQDVLVLSEELRLLRADLEPLVGEEQRLAVGQALASVRERACTLADQLRSIAHSLETSSVSREPLAQLLAREATSLTRRTAIECKLDVKAELAGLSDSQRITVYRVVQEALANAAEHSGASTVRIRVTESSTAISLTVADDGCGFDTTSGMAAAAQRGRLGLVGMSERVRLLGGIFRVTSAPGRGTTIRVVLTRWLPPAAD